MENIAKYLYEVGQLKRVKRSGWWVAGIDNPESVAEHSFRTAIIGYLLASLAGADPHKTAGICLFHDVHEARTNDQHYVVRNYFDLKSAEKNSFRDQLELFPPAIADQISELEYQVEPEKSTLEHELARDADMLECLIQALEYKAQGHQDVENFISSNLSRLKHQVSIELAEACLKTPISSWWKDLMA